MLEFNHGNKHIPNIVHFFPIFFLIESRRLCIYSSSRILSTSSPAPNNDAIRAEIHPGTN